MANLMLCINGVFKPVFGLVESGLLSLLVGLVWPDVNATIVLACGQKKKTLWKKCCLW